MGDIFFVIENYVNKKFGSHILIVVIFLGELLQLGDLFQIKWKKSWNFMTFRDFSPFFEIKKMNLATSKPRHFLGHHL